MVLVFLEHAQKYVIRKGAQYGILSTYKRVHCTYPSICTEIKKRRILLSFYTAFQVSSCSSSMCALPAIIHYGIQDCSVEVPRKQEKGGDPCRKGKESPCLSGNGFLAALQLRKASESGNILPATRLGLWQVRGGWYRAVPLGEAKRCNSCLCHPANINCATDIQPS